MRALTILLGLSLGTPGELIARETEQRTESLLPSALVPENSTSARQGQVDRLREIGQEMSRLRGESRQIRQSLKVPDQVLLTVTSFTIDRQKLVDVDPQLAENLASPKSRSSSPSPSAEQVVKQLNHLLEQQGNDSPRIVIKEGDFSLQLLGGKPTKFVSGGEFPIPLPTAQATGTQIEFREFGIAIEALAQQDADNDYGCEICFEVSQLDFATAVKGPGGQQIPGLQKRKVFHKPALPLGQTVQLHSLPVASSCWVLFAKLEEFPADVSEGEVQP